MEIEFECLGALFPKKKLHKIFNQKRNLNIDCLIVGKLVGNRKHSKLCIVIIHSICLRIKSRIKLDSGAY